MPWKIRSKFRPDGLDRLSRDSVPSAGAPRRSGPALPSTAMWERQWLTSQGKTTRTMPTFLTEVLDRDVVAEFDAQAGPQLEPAHWTEPAPQDSFMGAGRPESRGGDLRRPSRQSVMPRQERARTPGQGPLPPERTLPRRAVTTPTSTR